MARLIVFLGPGFSWNDQLWSRKRLETSRQGAIHAPFERWPLPANSAKRKDWKPSCLPSGLDQTRMWAQREVAGSWPLFARWAAAAAGESAFVVDKSSSGGEAALGSSDRK